MKLEDYYSFAFSVYGAYEKELDLGNSSVILNSHEDDFYYAGVFDGISNLGKRTYPKAENHTGAWIASKSSAKLCDYYLQNNTLTFSQSDSGRLERYLYNEMKKINVSASGENDFLYGGSSDVSLPASMAIFAVRQISKNKVDCEILQNGNARGYILDKNGVAQLTKDDTDKDRDALESLSAEESLKNYINADRRFSISYQKISVSLPCIFIVSSHGGYSGFQSPMDFEGEVLRALLECDDKPLNWKNDLNKCISKTSKEDYSIAIAAFGYDTFSDVKKHFVSRYKDLASEYLIPEMEADSKILKRIWKKYSTSYYRMIK